MEEKGFKQALRMPPQDLEAERSVLGSLMLDSKAINIIIDILRPEDFYHQKNQFIYLAMPEPPFLIIFFLGRGRGSEGGFFFSSGISRSFSAS